MSETQKQNGDKMDEKLVVVTAMVVSVLPTMWISYLYYRLQLHKLKQTKDKTVLLPKKE